MHQEKATLQRQLKPMHVWAVAFGCIVGWGSFINPGKKFLPNSGVAGTAIAMALGALVMIIIAFSYAYMVPKYPQAGGEFTFTKMCFGKRAAYVCGWFLVAAYLTNVPMNSTAIGLIVDGLDGSADILKFGFHYQIAGFDVWLGEMLLAMGILILFGLLNIWGVKKAGIVQSILAGDWVLLVAAEELLGTFGKVLVGIAVSCAVLSGIMGFYLASSRLMYSMSRDGFLPPAFGKIDKRYGTPKNAMIFCILISLSGPILGREALGWFVDMSAIGASIGYLCATCAATLVTLRRDGDGTPFLKAMAVTGVVFSVIFIVLQLIPIPGLSGVHFGKESYLMLIVWVAIGAVFYIKERKSFLKA